VKRKTRTKPPARKTTGRTPRPAPSRTTVARSKATPTDTKPPKKIGTVRRKIVVFASLLGALSLTSFLLLALAPAPLSPAAVQSLFAVGAPESMDAIFSTAVPLQSGRWNYIYIHQSKTLAGNAATLGDISGGLADHFVIGNGDGCGDGELQVGERWTDQTSAAAPPGRSLRSDCISICLVGDFDSAAPTPTQQRRLTQLLTALESHADIASSHIIALDGDSSSAGIGHFFTADAIKRQIAGHP
jgi:hypothetical protein